MCEYYVVREGEKRAAFSVVCCESYVSHFPIRQITEVEGHLPSTTLFIPYDPSAFFFLLFLFFKKKKVLFFSIKIDQYLIPLFWHTRIEIIKYSGQSELRRGRFSHLIGKEASNINFRPFDWLFSFIYIVWKKHAVEEEIRDETDN